MKKIIVFVSILISLTQVLVAQRGMLDNHIGVRFGLGSGVTFQHRFTDAKYVELIALGRYGGLSFTALYELHHPFFDVKSIKWYLGAGGHVGLYSDRARNFENEIGNSITLGVDGILGLEYFFRDFPLQLSVDWKPAFNLFSTTHSFNEWDNGAMSVRYRF